MSLPVRPPEPPSAPPPPPPLAVIPPSPDATIRDTPDRRYYALLEELVEEPLYDAAQLERGPATPRYFGTLPEPDREHPRSLLAPPMSPSTRRVTSSQSRRPSTRDAEVQVDADWDPDIEPADEFSKIVDISGTCVPSPSAMWTIITPRWMHRCASTSAGNVVFATASDASGTAPAWHDHTTLQTFLRR